MGQYWLPVNLDKKEFIDPHKLGVGLKLGEQLGSGHGTPDAMFILLAAMKERRGGGDFDWDTNYYGPERTMAHHSGAPVEEEYNVVAKRTIGRWVGDRVAVIGDYAENSDLPVKRLRAKTIYHRCRKGEFKDITDDVMRVIEHEIGGKFTGSGWKEFGRST